MIMAHAEGVRGRRLKGAWRDGGSRLCVRGVQFVCVCEATARELKCGACEGRGAGSERKAKKQRCNAACDARHAARTFDRQRKLKLDVTRIAALPPLVWRVVAERALGPPRRHCVLVLGCGWS